MKKKIALCMALCLLFCLSGCKRPAPPPKDTAEENFLEQPALHEEINLIASIDGEVHVPKAFADGTGNTYENMQRIGTTEEQQKQLEEFFLKDLKDVKKEVYDTASTVIYSIEMEGQTEPFCPMHIDDYYFGYFTPTSRLIDRFLTGFDLYKQYNDFPEEYQPDMEFSFATRQQAFEEIQKELGQLGIEIYDEYQCYPLSHTLMAAEEEKVLQTQEEGGLPKEVEAFGKWDESYDCYYFEFNPAVDGYPISRYGHGDSDTGDSANGARGDVYYSKDGIIEAHIGAFPQAEPAQTGQPLLTAEEALETVRKYYDNSLEGDSPTFVSGSTYEIRGVYLEMLPLRQDGSLKISKLVPAWRFDVWCIPPVIDTDGPKSQEQLERERPYQDVPLFVNAFNGERIR